jgi:branched-chain amino acid transport system substrate-binding protein
MEVAMQRVLCILFFCSLAVIVLGSGVSCKASPQNGADKVLQSVRQEIQNELDRLDRNLASAAQNLSGVDLGGTRARSILTGLLQDRPYIVDTCTVDRNGRILSVEPAAYREFEGSDISRQEQVIRLFRTQQPVLSWNFPAVEGFEAADLEHPVFSSNKEMIGAVSILFKPEILVGDIVSRMLDDVSLSIMIMQPDGRIIYDADSAEIGKNTFIDPLYQSFPQLIALAREMSAEKSGAGRYEFYNTGLKQTVQKVAIWQTLGLYGTEWRVVLIRESSKQGYPPLRAS